jgi:hypothetical protein
MAGKQETVVAMVVLRPASGRAVTGAPGITKETLHEFAPDRGDAETVARTLADAGFEVGPTVGIGMSIAAPRARFEEVFGTEVAEAEDGGWVAAGAGRELPLDALPGAVRERVHAVTFEEPAEADAP